MLFLRLLFNFLVVKQCCFEYTYSEFKDITEYPIGVQYKVFMDYKYHIGLA